MKVSENFTIEEFVPKDIFSVYGDKSIQFIDPKIIKFAQWLRTSLGKIVTINNWHTEGTYNLSGFRPPNCAIGAPLSQHRFGRAIDLKVMDMFPSDVRRYIVDHFESDHLSEMISTIEDGTPTWTHVDCRPVLDPSKLNFVPFYK